MRLDSEAHITAIPCRLVRPKQLTGNHKEIIMITGGSVQFPTAKVAITVKDTAHETEVIVLPDTAREVLIGVDFPNFDKYWKEAPLMVGAVTRAKRKVQAQEVVKNNLADKQDGVIVKPLNVTNLDCVNTPEVTPLIRPLVNNSVVRPPPEPEEMSFNPLKAQANPLQ